jgi:hypothetical protein
MTINEALKNAQSAKEIKLSGQYQTSAIVLADEVIRLRALLRECAPHVFATAKAEHMLDGFGTRKLRANDNLAERLRKELE